MGHSGAWLLHDRATCHKAETNRIHGLPGPKSGPGAPRFMAGQMWATWLTRSPRRTVDSLFSCFAVEVLVVGFRIGTGMVYDAVPMIRRRIKRIKLQWDISGIDDVMIPPSRDYYCEASADRRPNAIENRLTDPLLHAKELVGLVDFRQIGRAHV